MRFKLRHLSNESGMTLVIVMVLAAAALMIMAALLYMATSGTEVSGMGARYANAFEAAVGGTDVMKGLINVGQADTFVLQTPGGVKVTSFTPAQISCTDTKLTETTNLWTANPNCTASSDSSWTIDPTDTATYDMQLSLGGNYTVYAKIVDTIQGNTQLSATKSGLRSANGSSSHPGYSVQHIPSIYTIEALAQNAASPERSKVSAAYEY